MTRPPCPTEPSTPLRDPRPNRGRRPGGGGILGRWAAVIAVAVLGGAPASGCAGPADAAPACETPGEAPCAILDVGEGDTGDDAATVDSAAPPETADTGAGTEAGAPGPDAGAGDAGADDAATPDAATPTPPPTIPILFSIHMEARTARQCGAGIAEKDCVDEAEWAENMETLDDMIHALDAAGLKGTFMYQIQWFQRLDLSETGRAITQKMLDNGHEIAVHHHGWDHADPDGYTNKPEAQGQPGFLGTMDVYMEVLDGWSERWSYTPVTVEGTGLTLDNDQQPEWIYRTSDDHTSASAYALPDPDDLCGFADGSGKPAWKAIALPSRAKPGQGFSTLGHTYFGRAAQANPNCLGLIAANILERTASILSDGPAIDDAINMVLHPVLDYGSSAFTAIYQQFFMDISGEGGIGMTVRDFMCQRAGYCE